jgi:D-tyrosyl-tRNA(Tyr) deacylase
MKAVIQRVGSASVKVDGKAVSSIGRGLAVLLGVADGDGESEALELSKKCVELRVFEDQAGKMNLSLLDVSGEMLVVSQFTLCADTRRGRRPSFTGAAAPEDARKLYEVFMAAVRSRGVTVRGGVFGAKMDVEIVNRGPVTLVLETQGHGG